VKPNINKMLKDAQRAQEKMQEEISALRCAGTSGGGVIRAVCDGNRNLVELTISPEALEDPDPGMVADLVLAAVNDAQRVVDAEVQKKMSALAGMMGLPPGLGF